MRRWAWILLALASLVAGVLTYAAANLNRYLSDNRDALAERASAALGRNVTFDQVEVSFAHGLGVAVDGLSVADDPRFASGSFLDAARAVVRVRVLPALFGRYEIASVLLDSPKLSVVRTKDGLNVASIGAKPDAKQSGEASSSSGAVAVALVDVENGKLVFTDHTAKPVREISIDALDLSASDWSAGESLRFELAAAILGAGAPNLKASGAVGPFDPSDSSKAALDVVVQLDDLDAKSLVAALAPTAGLRASGPLRAKVHAGGSVGAPTLALSLDAGAAAVAYGTTLDKPADVPLSVVGNVARDAAGAIALDSVALTLGSAVIDCSGKLEPARDSYSYALALTGSSVALDALGQVLPSLRAETLRGVADIDLKVAAGALGAPERLNGRVSLDALEVGGGTSDVPLVSQLTSVLSFDGRSMTMPRSDLRIAGQPATLEASCADIYAPRVRFALASPELALDELGVAGAAEGDSLDRLNVAGTLASTAESVDVDADVRAESGKLAGVAFTNLTAKIKRHGGTLELAPISFGTSDGQVRGNATYAPASPGGADRLRFDGRAEGVSVAALVGGFTGRTTSLLDGKLTADLHADGAGKDWPTLRQALTGSGKIELLDGALRGVNIADGALAGITGLPGLSGLLPAQLQNDFPLFFGTDDTRFDTMSAALEIAAGRIATKDLAISARDFLVQAGGTIGLDGSVDLGATLLPSVALSQRLIEQASVLKHLVDRNGRVAIPFRLAGALPAAKPVPDLSVLSAALQRDLIDNLGERVLDGLKKPAAPPTKPATVEKAAPVKPQQNEPGTDIVEPPSKPQKKPRADGKQQPAAPQTAPAVEEKQAPTGAKRSKRPPVAQPAPESAPASPPPVVPVPAPAPPSE